MVGGPERQIMGWLMCRPKRLDCNEVKCVEKTDFRLGQRLHQIVHTGVTFARCA
jgi:hypothetical protein